MHREGEDRRKPDLGPGLSPEERGGGQKRKETFSWENKGQVQAEVGQVTTQDDRPQWERENVAAPCRRGLWLTQECANALGGHGPQPVGAAGVSVPT